MEPDIEQLITNVKTAQTTPAIARATLKLLRACDIWNVQEIGQELARLSVTGGPEGGK
jgi:hypothetical protein